MEKLTLENIAPFLPYGLKGNLINDEYYEPVYAGELFRIETGLTTKKREPEPFVIVDDYEDYLQYFTPILRPMDLTKPIILEGKEVIPIVELAKIAFPRHDWFHVNAKNVVTEDKEKGFEFDGKDFDFYNMHDGKILPVYNQLALFQWLFKHKFDVFGLIPLGLAIDINTLETNPYN